MCLIFVYFIISDAGVLKLKVAVSGEIQLHVAEMNSREIKRILNLGSKIKFKNIPAYFQYRLLQCF